MSGQTPIQLKTEDYIRSLWWSPDTPDIVKTLVAGNIRGYLGWLLQQHDLSDVAGAKVDHPTTEVVFTYSDHFQMRLAVHAAVRVEGSQKAAAKRFGISQGYLSDILRGNRDVPDAVARFFGLTRRVVYVPADDEARAFYTRGGAQRSDA